MGKVPLIGRRTPAKSLNLHTNSGKGNASPRDLWAMSGTRWNRRWIWRDVGCYQLAGNRRCRKEASLMAYSNLPNIRNRNKGWVTFPDGRQAPVYTWNHSSAEKGTAYLPAWSQAYLAELLAQDVSAQKKSRWKKECALTERLLAEHGGRVRALVVRHDNDQTWLFMTEFKQEGG
jgi:hypothetical protein